MGSDKQIDTSAFEAQHDSLREEKEAAVLSRIAPVDDLSQVVAKIDLEDLLPDPHQPRRNFDPKKIAELADSLRQHGQMEPLIVRPVQGPQHRGKYWVVSGERRLRAAKELGMKELDCRIRNLDPVTSAVFALAANVHRSDLSEIEKAEALAKLKTMTAYTWERVAELVGISHVYIRQLSGMLKLSEPVKQDVRSGAIPTRTAIALKALPEAEQLRMAERVKSEGLTAEQVRAETQDVVRPRAIRKVADLQVPGTIGKLAAKPELTPEEQQQSRAGTKTRLLEDSIKAVQNIQKAIDRETWAPSSTSDRQVELLAELYQALSSLHQEVVYIRGPFKDAAEKAKKDTKNLLRVS